MALISLKYCLGMVRQSTLGAIVVFSAVLPYAPLPAAASGCDSAFMSKMQERAWMEAQREVMNNEKAIWKPDSVLALSCFKGQVNDLEISYSRDECVGGSGACAGSDDVTEEVTDGATGYLGSAYPSNLGGGNTTIAQKPDAAPGDCDSQDKLWEEAKCANVDPVNSFPSFEDLSSTDNRTAPTACTTNPTGEWDKGKTDMAAVGLNMGAGKFDTVNLFLNVWAPLSTLSSGSCFSGIPTGVKVGGASGFEEVVCPNPGCTPVLSGTTVTCNPM